MKPVGQRPLSPLAALSQRPFSPKIEAKSAILGIKPIRLPVNKSNKAQKQFTVSPELLDLGKKRAKPSSKKGLKLTSTSSKIKQFISQVHSERPLSPASAILQEIEKASKELTNVPLGKPAHLARKVIHSMDEGQLKNLKRQQFQQVVSSPKFPSNLGSREPLKSHIQRFQKSLQDREQLGSAFTTQPTQRNRSGFSPVMTSQPRATPSNFMKPHLNLQELKLPQLHEQIGHRSPPLIQHFSGPPVKTQHSPPIMPTEQTSSVFGLAQVKTESQPITRNRYGDKPYKTLQPREGSKLVKTPDPGFDLPSPPLTDDFLPEAFASSNPRLKMKFGTPCIIENSRHLELEYRKALLVSSKLAKNANKFKNQPFLLLFSIKEREETKRNDPVSLKKPQSPRLSPDAQRGSDKASSHSTAGSIDGQNQNDLGQSESGDNEDFEVIGEVDDKQRKKIMGSCFKRIREMSIGPGQKPAKALPNSRQNFFISNLKLFNVISDIGNIRKQGGDKQWIDRYLEEVSSKIESNDNQI